MEQKALLGSKYQDRGVMLRNSVTSHLFYKILLDFVKNY